MKILFLLFLLLPGLISCNPAGKNQKVSAESILFQPEDRQILEEVFEIFGNEKELPVPVLMIKIGTFFKETPYVASTLEISPEKEKLVVNLREMDCTTFAENCLAIARTIKKGAPTFEKFAAELQSIRYRQGKIDGYPSRLHYFSDWIFDNSKKQIVKDLSKDLGGEPFSKTVNFMSTHPESYEQLQDSSLIPLIAETEKQITKRQRYFIPEDKIAGVEDLFMDGDIAGITTGIEGLDIVHVVLLVRRGGRIHMLHASSSAEKVVLSDETLEAYLKSSKNRTGIVLARPVN